MASRRFIQCDVFTTTPTKGNGLAVVVDSEGLSDAQMQSFAAWTNLAETTFLLPPTNPAADYKLRIFTPGREMLFAGHPTLGSCAAWLKTGGVSAEPGLVRQECGIGIVEIDLTGAVPAFVAPATKVEPMADAEFKRITAALGLSHDQVIRSAQLTNGPVWQLLELTSAEAALNVDENQVLWPEFVGVAVMGAYPANAPFDFEVRNISPSSGMSEDPITGSLNAAIAQWMRQDGRLTQDLLMSQGTKMGREGRVFIQPDRREIEKVWVGGHTQMMIEGILTF